MRAQATIHTEGAAAAHTEGAAARHAREGADTYTEEAAARHARTGQDIHTAGAAAFHEPGCPSTVTSRPHLLVEHMREGEDFSPFVAEHARPALGTVADLCTATSGAPPRSHALEFSRVPLIVAADTRPRPECSNVSDGRSASNRHSDG